MKKLLLALFILFSITHSTYAQMSKSSFLNTVDINKIKAADIPDESQLKTMGISDEEIATLMEIKKQKLLQESNKDIKNTESTETKVEPKKIEKEAVTVPPDTIYKIPNSTVFGQEILRNKNINSFDKAEMSRVQDDYILSSEDQLTISAWGYSDYNQTFTLDKEGFIYVKESGRIYLKGMRFDDARQLIEKKFGSFLDLRNSKVDIFLASARIITINIVGEVLAPGSYTIPATSTAFNALMIANGTNEIGSLRKIYIRRGGKTIRTLDLYEFLMNPEKGDDFFLENNDYILVPSSDKIVHVSGEVKRPHTYELTAKEGLNELMKYSGGIKSSGFTNSILIKRIQENKTFFLDINFDSLIAQKKNFPLIDGDSLVIKTIPNIPEGFVEIRGSVRVPGKFEFIEGQKISDLLKSAQGIHDETYIARAYLIRLKPDLSKQYFAVNIGEVLSNNSSADNLELKSYDVLEVYSKKRFVDQDSISVYGSVRHPGRYLFGEGLKVKDAIYLSGGFLKEAANNRIEISRLSNIGKGSQDTSRVIILTAKIYYDLSMNKDIEDFKLQPYDQIFIRQMATFEYQQNVVLQGEVLYPGVYSLIDKNERLFDVIKRAGGLTEWAFPEATRLFRTEDKLGFLFLNFKSTDLTKPDFPSNYVLKENDTIFVPRLNELVSLKGAIEYPNIASIGQINTPYFKHKRAKFYIIKFGVGFAKGAKKGKTYVTQPGGFVKRTVSIPFINIYPKVSKGSVITVVFKGNKDKQERRKSEPIDWNKIIEGTTIKLTALLTIWLLLTQINKN